MTDELRGRLQDVIDEGDRAAKTRRARMAASLAPTLGELAVSVYENAEREDAEVLKRARANQDRLRAEYLRRVAARDLPTVRELVADTLDLPADDPRVAALSWTVDEEPFESARFTEGDSGSIKAQDVTRAGVQFRTEVDGLPLIAKLNEYGGTQHVTLTAVISEGGSTMGVANMKALGEQISEHKKRTARK
jgi:hypothetical protein